MAQPTNGASDGVRPEPEHHPHVGVRSPSKDLGVLLISDSPGLLEVPAQKRTVVSIHVGPPSYIACRRGEDSYRGTAIHGDIDIIPAGLPSTWELKDSDSALILSIAERLLHSVAEESDMDPRCVAIRNRFQVRDVQIEHIGWALQAEMERGYPCGRLYTDSLATALAAQLVRNHSAISSQPGRPNGGLSGRRLKQVMAFIEENLGNDLSLSQVSGVAGLSVSHFKVLFRQSVGLPVHQYVIRRRVERAAMLLRRGDLSISRIALETGFAHQSHLALHMRRVLGVSPKRIRDTQ
jgi:AraC family transcriptional regulator